VAQPISHAKGPDFPRAWSDPPRAATSGYRLPLPTHTHRWQRKMRRASTSKGPAPSEWHRASAGLSAGVFDHGRGVLPAALRCCPGKDDQQDAGQL